MKGPLGRLRRRYENNIKMNLINRKGNRGLDIHVCLCLCVCVCVCVCVTLLTGGRLLGPR